MTTGVVVAIDQRWQGGTLTAAVTATDTVLPLDDAADFDEELTERRWLTIGDETTPREYIAVANDEEVQESVTLAAAVGGAGFEAGLPVHLWDVDAVTPADPRSIEVVVKVRPHDGGKPFTAAVPSGMVPTAGTSRFIGASVRLVEKESGSWWVDEVMGREPVVEGTTVQTSATGKRVVLIAGSSPAVLLYTADPDEISGGQLSNTLVEVGAFKSLITQLVSPKIAGATNQAVISLQSTNDGGAISRSVTIAADKLVLNGDRVESPNLYLTAPPTTAAAANVNIGPAGQLRESTSSKRFKLDIQPAAVDVAAVLKILTVSFRDRGEVHADPATTRRYIGVTAEQLHELGLVEFVTYEDDGRPRAVQYDRLVLALLAVVKHQDQRLARIEAALKLAPLGA